MKRISYLLLASVFLISGFVATAFAYDPNHWTSCIIDGQTMEGEPVENEFWCNSYDGTYEGQPTELSECGLEGFGIPDCSGNTVGLYPTMR